MTPYSVILPDAARTIRAPDQRRGVCSERPIGDDVYREQVDRFGFRRRLGHEKERRITFVREIRVEGTPPIAALGQLSAARRPDQPASAAESGGIAKGCARLRNQGMICLRRGEGMGERPPT